MPNHVTNIIEVVSLGDHSWSELSESLLIDGMVDFNAIIKSPECLKDFEPHMGILSRARLALGLVKQPAGRDDFIANLTFQNDIRDAITPAKKEDYPEIVRAIQNYEECGYLYWYDWQNEHWGTKWNAYSQPTEGWPDGCMAFRFETAWSHPSEIIAELSRRLSSADFFVRYADEDMGSNCGKYYISNGVRRDESISKKWSDMTKLEQQKSKEFAFSVRYPGEDPKDHGMNEKYEYVDE